MKFIIALLILVSIVECVDKTKEIKGLNGSDGESCVAETRADGRYIVCNGSEIKIVDGTDGKDGADGDDGDDGTNGTYVEYVKVCPLIAGNLQQTLIKLGNEYLSYLSEPNYKKDRLVVLNENTLYTTTDERKVKFTIINGAVDCSLNGSPY